MTVQALREIRLYGDLGRQFGRVHRLAVLTPAEAVQALAAVLPGFQRAFIGAPGQPRRRYHVFVGRSERRVDIGIEEADAPVGVTEPIRIVPVIEGAKRGGLLQIMVGAALMFAAPYAAGALFGAGASVGLSVGVSTYGVALGKALILGGIVQLLSPQRQAAANVTPENEPSYGFDNGPVNDSRQGGPVPLAFGRVIVGSVTISGGLSTDDLVLAAPAAPIPPQPLPPYQDPYPWGYGDSP